MYSCKVIVEKHTLKFLTVGDKIKIVNQVKRGVKRKKALASNFGIPASTLSTILKNNDKILKVTDEVPSLLRWQRFKESSFPETDQATVEWIKRTRDNNLSISGPLIRGKAVEFAKNLGLTFQASAGWLNRFRSRNGIVKKY